MKKLALVALLGLASTAVVAAPVGTTFTGWGVGVDLTSTKYEGLKRASGVGVVVDYGIDYGNDLVGLVEGKVKINSSKLVNIKDKTTGSYAQADEKWRANVSYLQGYRVLPDLLPYVKVGYNVTKIDGKIRDAVGNIFEEGSFSETASGLTFGAGVKYSVSSNFELGAEYLRSQAKANGEKVKANTLGANATYRF